MRREIPAWIIWLIGWFVITMVRTVIAETKRLVMGWVIIGEHD